MAEATQPSLAEAAWFAGLFEGEGCLTQPKHRNCWRLMLGMTDQDVIQRIQQVWGVGTIHTRSMRWAEKKGKAYKPQWSWGINEGAEIYRIGCAIYPYLGKRRQAKFRRVLHLLDSLPHSRVFRSSVATV